MLTCHAKHETNSRTLNVTNECSVAKTGVWKCTLVLYMEIAVKCAWQGSRWGQQIIEDIYLQQMSNQALKGPEYHLLEGTTGARHETHNHLL